MLIDNWFGAYSSIIYIYIHTYIGDYDNLWECETLLSWKSGNYGEVILKLSRPGNTTYRMFLGTPTIDRCIG